MLRTLNRWLTSYRYYVNQSELPPFEITIRAVDRAQATQKAACIGKTLGILLTGPIG